MFKKATDSQTGRTSVPVVAKKPSIRQQLKEFIRRYYSLLKLLPVEARQTLEIYPGEGNIGTSPQMEFVFDRKALRENPKAELITFNSAKLKEIIDIVMEKGRVAKGFIPFIQDPTQDFPGDLRQLIAEGNPEKGPEPQFLLNGGAQLLEHHLKYAPFLVILLKITLATIEPQEFIETVVIPVIDEKEITARNTNSFIEKVKVYLESSAPIITETMPVPGDLLDFTDQKVKAALQSATQSIFTSIEERKKVLEDRLAKRCKKEIDVIEKYYADREREIEDKIESDDEKATDTNKSAAYRKQKKENLPKLHDEIQQLRDELEAKRNECTEMYAISTDFNVVAAAAIYIPADFHYTCKLTSEYGSTERNFFYDIFEEGLIPPTCDACGKPVYQGRLCANLHLCCSTCGAPCKQCQKHVCRACDARSCRICSANLCKDHSFECSRCSGKERGNYWACQDHVGTCAACGTPICDWCAITCAMCGKRFCKEEKACSVTCNLCNQPVCTAHAISCPICGKYACKRDVGTCPSCHQTYCVTHLIAPSYKCETCLKYASRASIAYFQKFRRNKGIEFQIPPQVGIPPSPQKIYVNVGNKVLLSPKHLAKIRLGKNRRYSIFRIPTIADEYILVVDKLTGTQTLYRNPRFLGRVKEYLTRKRQDLVFMLETPAVTGPKIAFTVPKDASAETQGLTPQALPELELEMPACPHCGKEVREDINFCPHCGAQLSEENEA